MINLSRRSYEKELMDGDDIPFEAMAQTLKELNIVNTRLGGHAITTKGIRALANGKQSLTVCEIGCGGGDNLNAIHRKFINTGVHIDFIGVDLNATCIEYARHQYPGLPCQWIHSDYAEVHFPGRKPDIIFSSLFCHHFTDEQLVFMLRWLRENSLTGFFINDLHRHWLAFYLIKYITRYFSRSYLVKNDASLSVARSFKKRDWQRLLSEAGINDYSISWRWAFRWLVSIKHVH